MRASHALALVILLLALPALAPAQVPGPDHAERLVAEGRYDDARAALDRWLETARRPGSGSAPAERVAALLLRAQLAPDFDRARPRYLDVMLGHPATPEAAEALLRLGQGFLAADAPARAADYLSRLATDHPTSEQHDTASRLLARIRGGDAGPSRSPADPAAPADADSTARAAVEPAVTTDRDSVARSGDEPARPLRFSVQTGAFRNPGGADALARRLRGAGFEPRLVYVPRNDLLRVRIGRFRGAEDAAALARRLRTAGFDAVVVGDAPAERTR